MGKSITLRMTATTKNGRATADLTRRVRKLCFAKNFQSLLVSVNLCVLVRCHTIAIANNVLNLQCLQQIGSNVSLKMFQSVPIIFVTSLSYVFIISHSWRFVNRILGFSSSLFCTKFPQKKLLNLYKMTNSGPRVCKGPAAF